MKVTQLALLGIVSFLTTLPARAQFPFPQSPFQPVSSVPSAPSGFDQGPFITFDKRTPQKGHVLIKTTSRTSKRARRRFIKRRGKNPSPRQLRRQIARMFGFRKSEYVSASGGILHATGRRNNNRKIQRALERGLASIVEENYKIYRFQAADLSDDFFCSFGLCWSIESESANPLLGGGTGDDVDVDAPEAWDISEGEGIVVGVIDTGVFAAHPDLAENIWQNSKERDNGVDDDNNGFADDFSGWDFVNDDNDADDDNFHGTHVAGIIAALCGNGRGVVGVAPKSKILPLKVLGADGSGDTANLLAAIDYATELKKQGVNIKVLNASLGGGQSTELIRDAIKRAGDEGIVFVAASGNSTADNDKEPVYPSNYGTELDNVISVASIDQTGEISSFSNFGKNSVHVAAPGGNVWSTIIFNFYLPAAGTSMAAPHVAGVAALLAAQNPGMTPSDIRDRIMNSTKPLESLNGKIISPGTVSALQALE